jgi:hypothetical protein
MHVLFGQLSRAMAWLGHRCNRFMLRGTDRHPHLGTHLLFGFLVACNVASLCLNVIVGGAWESFAISITGIVGIGVVWVVLMKFRKSNPGIWQRN